jgi:acyl-CoA reductase-like NAD-dependent aldehyde dehydrogenase
VVEGLRGALGKLTGDDGRAVELLGGVVNAGVLERLGQVGSSGDVVIESREVTHPAFEDAVVRTPAVVVLDVSDGKTYETECFGPVAYLIKTGSTAESIDTFRRTVIEHGAMTAAVYSTSDDVIGAMRSAALDAGVALSENLTGQVFVNQSAAFSDFHGTGANPAANATYTDGAYVASRFRFIQSRRHI